MLSYGKKLSCYSPKKYARLSAFALSPGFIVEAYSTGTPVLSRRHYLGFGLGVMAQTQGIRKSIMNLYVGNLSYQMTQDDLKAAFEAYGEVKAVRIIKDKETQRSKGFGFVEMATADAGRKAIEGLNNKDIKGRPIRVSEARERS